MRIRPLYAVYVFMLLFFYAIYARYMLLCMLCVCESYRISGTFQVCMRLASPVGGTEPAGPHTPAPAKEAHSGAYPGNGVFFFAGAEYKIFSRRTVHVYLW